MDKRIKILNIILCGIFVMNSAMNIVAFASKKPVLRKKSTSLPSIKELYDINTLLYLIEKDLNCEKLSEASDLVNKALSIEPRNTRLYFLCTILYLKTNQLDSAEIAARKLLAVENKNYQGINLLGDIYIEKSKTAPTYSQKDDDLRLALKCYKTIYADLPSDPRSFIGMSKVYYQQNDYDRALGQLVIARELDKTNAKTLYSIGEFHFKQRDYFKALNYLNESVKYSRIPDYNTHILLGNIYERLADLQKAKYEYEIILKLNPNDEKVIERYKTLEDL